MCLKFCKSLGSAEKEEMLNYLNDQTRYSEDIYLMVSLLCGCFSAGQEGGLRHHGGKSGCFQKKNNLGTRIILSNLKKQK